MSILDTAAWHEKYRAQGQWVAANLREGRYVDETPATQLARFVAWSAREHDEEHHVAAVAAFREGLGG